MLSSLSNRTIFSRNIFISRIAQKNTYFLSHFHEEREFHHCFSSCFHHYFLRRHKKFSLLAKSKDFDFFKATLSTLNITYIKPIYIKSSFGFHSNNGTTVLKLKTLSRSLLKNLILQNCLHRLNIWGCRYYTKIHDIIVSFCIFSLLMCDWIWSMILLV